MGGLLALAFVAGMTAPVNPCGFALLPGWITLSIGDTHTRTLSARLSRALLSGVAVTIGFAGTLVAVGLLVSAGARTIIDAAPWLGLTTGLVLLALAVGMLTGRTFGLRLPRLRRAPARRGNGVAGSLAYGVGFAAASLSCTFGVLLAVIAQAQATATFVGLLTVFAVYAAGSATILLVLAVAAAFVGTALTRCTAALARYGPRLTALLLAATGAYLIWYWYPTVANGRGATRTGGVASAAATVSTWVQAHSTLVAVAAAGIVLLALTLITIQRRTPVAGTHEQPARSRPIADEPQGIDHGPANPTGQLDHPQRDASLTVSGPTAHRHDSSPDGSCC